MRHWPLEPAPLDPTIGELLGARERSIIHYILHIIYYTLYIIYYMLYITYYILYIICYILYIIGPGLVGLDRGKLKRLSTACLVEMRGVKVRQGATIHDAGRMHNA